MSTKTSYLLDPDGKVIESTGEDTAINLATGYLPASPKQIEEFKKEQAYRAKYETPGQQVATFAEGAAQPLTFGLSTPVERAFGVKPEDIKGREEINPGVHLAGTVTGVAAPLILSGGASALGGAAKATAPSLIARAGEGAAELLPEAASTVAGRLGLAVAKGAVTAGTEGAIYGAGHVVHEIGLGDPNLTAQSALEEIGLSGLLGAGIGAGTGALGQLIGEAAGSQLGHKLEEMAHTFEANQNIKTAAGPGGGKKALTWLYKKFGPEGANKLGQEAGELGLIKPLDGPPAIFEKSGQMMEDVGPKIDEGLAGIDAAGAESHPTAGELIPRIKKGVLKDLDVVGGDKALVRRVGDELDGYVNELGGADAKVSFTQMNDIRRAIGKRIYGYNGDQTVSTAYKGALRDIARELGDEITEGIERAGMDAKPLLALNRQYSVAATINHIAENGMTKAGLSGVPLTALITGGAGLIHGGPLGAAALGLGAMLAKRYGPQALAAGARSVRRFVDEAGAESVINKTAEVIANERAEAAASQVPRLTQAWNQALEHAEPIAAPIKDVSREQLKERLATGEGSSSPERTAALSQLAKANRVVSDRVDGLAEAVVRGKRVARGELSEGAAHAAARTAEEYEKQVGQIHQLADNPDLMQKHLTSLTSDVHQHAPDTAQALSLAAARATAYLQAKFPKPPKPGPLAPTLKPSGAQIHKLNQTKAVLGHPSLLLKHAANLTLTNDHVEAVAAVFPERLQQMQMAVMDKLSAHDNKVPYGQRLMLSKLFGASLDGTTRPQSIQSAQLAYSLPSAKAPENQAGGGGAVRSSQTGLSKLNLSSAMQSAGRASEMRRNEVA